MRDKPLDVYATAVNLRRWSNALKIPSGGFVNKDLMDAATMLDNYAQYLTTLTPKEKACDECAGWGEWIEQGHMRCCPVCNGTGVKPSPQESAETAAVEET